MKKSNILFVLLLWSFSVNAQIQWEKSFGGTNQDYARYIIQTNDSGYIVAGQSNSNDSDVTGNHNGLDYWLVKLDASGNLQWQKSLGGTADDIAYSIVQTNDSGYVTAGITESNDGDVTVNFGDEDYWVVKLDSSGAIQWQKSFGGTGNEGAYSIIQTYNNGYIVAGYSWSDDGDITGHLGSEDYWVVKLNASGNIQWQKSLGGTDEDKAYSLIQTSDSGYVVAGWSNSNDVNVSGNHGGNDYWVVKLDEYGNIQWQKSLGGTDDDEAHSIIQTYDSGFVVAGVSYSNNGDVTANHGNGDYWLAKLDASGILQWQKSLGGTSEDYANSVTQDSDSGFVVTGFSASNDGDITGNHGSNDYWVVKVNSTGNIQWQKSFGGTVSEIASSIVQTSDNEYIIAGGSNSINGDVTDNHGYYDYWIVKLGAATGIENLYTSNAINIYPNPSTNSFSISSNTVFENGQLNIFNSMGCNVYSCRMNRETKVIDTANFTSGIYYLQIIKGEKMWAEKIIKQ